MNKKNPPKNWRNILWREWRNTDDEEYAERLLYLLAHKIPSRWVSALFMMVWGMIWGAIIGSIFVLVTVCFNAIFAGLFQPIFEELNSIKLISAMGLFGGAFGILMTPLLNKRLKWAGLFFRFGMGAIIGLLAFLIGRSIPVAFILGTLAGTFGVSFATQPLNDKTELVTAMLLLKYINSVHFVL